MVAKTLRESITSVLGGDDIDEDRMTITPQMKQELEAEEKQIAYFFRFDQFLNFDANLSGFRNEDYDQQTSWFFYFIDIIYVATIFNISHLITKCGEEPKVYVMAASYFTIMFTTRMFFDTFTSILHANGVLHTLIFILYGLGVYCMTVNIAAVTDTTALEEICSEGIGSLVKTPTSTLSDTNLDLSQLYLSRALQETNTTSSDPTFGSCYSDENFDFGFALSFLFTRSLIFVLFFLYCTVFHHVKHSSNGKGHGDSNHSSTGNSNSTSNRNRVDSDHKSVELTSPQELTTSTATTTSTANPIPTNTNATTNPSATNTNTNSNTTNTNTSTTTTADNTELAHKAHINKVLKWKIVPLVISCVLMLFTFTFIPTFIIFPTVAIVEILGDIIPELLVNMEGIKPDRHNLEERLGLMFMLVLGETMLGFLVQRGNAVIDLQTYSTLIPAYILVIAVGMQYFKNAQFPHLEPGSHPLDRPVYSATYTWLSAMLSFIMLVAANGLVEIYNEITDLGQRSENIQEKLEMKKISVCLFSVWVIMLLLHLLEGTYWDVIVRRTVSKVCRLCCGWCGSAGGKNGKGSVGETAGNINSDSSGDTNTDNSSAFAHTNPIHTANDTNNPRTTSTAATTDTHDTIRTSVSDTTDYSRYSTTEPSRYPYSNRKVRNMFDRNSTSRDSVSRYSVGDSAYYSAHANTAHTTNNAQDAHTTEPPAPAIFNKRLFFLKLGVAFVHLYTHTFNIDAQYFVVVNAMVALVPQLAEVILEFVDLQQRLKRIRAQLKLKVEAA